MSSSPPHTDLGNLVGIGSVDRLEEQAQRWDASCTCDLMLPKFVVFVRLLQGLDGRMVDLSKPLQYRWGQRRLKEGEHQKGHTPDC